MNANMKAALLCLSCAAALLVLLALQGCAGWESKGYAALGAAHRVGVAAEPTILGDAFCRPVVEACKRDGVHPCPRLDKCQAAQVVALKILKQWQQTIVTGWRAVAMGDQVSAFKMVALGAALGDQLQTAISDWR